MFSIPKRELSKFRVTNREECGVIVADGKSLKIIRVENVADSNSDFAIRMIDFQEIENALGVAEYVFGFFHTHLAHHDPSPSDQDLEGASIFPHFTSCVYHPITGSLSWYGFLTEGTNSREEASVKLNFSTSVEQEEERRVRRCVDASALPPHL